jgi:hypothetical protein
MIRVRLPRISHARSEPIKAFPKPIHVEAIPKFHPNCPAYPTKITAEKYDVPNAKALSHGPTDLEPRTNPATLLACLLVLMPIVIITAKKMMISTKVRTVVVFINNPFSITNK